jgi:hypothetical protein
MKVAPRTACFAGGVEVAQTGERSLWLTAIEKVDRSFTAASIFWFKASRLLAGLKSLPPLPVDLRNRLRRPQYKATALRGAEALRLSFLDHAQKSLASNKTSTDLLKTIEYRPGAELSSLVHFHR